jgi:hypothetical protein
MLTAFLLLGSVGLTGQVYVAQLDISTGLRSPLAQTPIQGIGSAPEFPESAKRRVVTSSNTLEQLRIEYPPLGSDAARLRLQIERSISETLPSFADVQRQIGTRLAAEPQRSLEQIDLQCAGPPQAASGGAQSIDSLPPRSPINGAPVQFCTQLTVLTRWTDHRF